MIEEFLAAVSLAGFILFLIPGQFRKYFASAAWICLVAMIFANFPEYFHDNNLAYPVIALVSLPVLFITVKLLLKENITVFSVTKGAAVAFIIYAPFAYLEPAGNLLISANVSIIQLFLNSVGFVYTMPEWNMFMHDVFRVEIVLGCTGIQAIAVMTGILATIPSELSKKVISAAIIITTVVVMNFVRNIFVILAYTQQWFQFLPEISSNGQYGYESFFWAHNIISEFGLSLLTVIIILTALIKINPGLKEFIREIILLYSKELKILFRTKKKIN
ncbi:MAG: archaeosortase A [Methanomicrobiaceae archaeon]|nr:archaeosortase A [Methanomicrobiaceae archaeon]